MLNQNRGSNMDYMDLIVGLLVLFMSYKLMMLIETYETEPEQKDKKNAK